MASIFSLFGEIYIDNEKANKSIKDTTQKGEDAGKKTGSAMSKVGSAASKAGKTVAVAGVAMATAAVAGAAALAEKALESADNLQKLSDQTGYSAEQLQIMQYQGRALGVDLETMTGSLRKVTKTMSNAKLTIDGDPEKMSATAKAYKALGVAVTDSNGNLRDSKTVMGEALNALGNVKNETERDALSMQIFGKSAMDLNPLIKAGSDGLNDLAEKAKASGAVMSNEAVSGLDSFGDNIDALKLSLTGMAGSILSSMMPSLQGFLDLITQNMPMIQNIFATVIPIVVQILQTLLPPLMQIAQSLLPPILNIIKMLLPFIQQVIIAILPVLTQLLMTLLPPVIQIVQMLLPLLLALLKPLLPILQPLFALLTPLINMLMALITPLIDILNKILPPLANIIGKYMNWYLPKLTAAFNFVAKVVSGSVKNAFKNLEPIIDGLKKYLQGIINFVKGVFSGDWKAAWEGIKTAFSGIWDTFIGIVKAPLNGIIGLVNGVIDGLNNIKMPDWVPGIGGKGIDIPHIPKLKVGLDYVPYDEFPALLHKGERVLTAKENKNYSTGGNIDYDRLGSVIANAMTGSGIYIDGRKFGRWARDNGI